MPALEPAARTATIAAMDTPATDALRLIQTTVANEEDARLIARALVEARLAACVQTERIVSTYAWRGAIEESAEIRLTIKTVPDRRDACLAWLRARHPYDLPELVVLDARASREYAQWANDVTRKD